MKKNISLTLLFLLLFLVFMYLTLTNKLNGFDKNIYEFITKKPSIFLDNYFKVLTNLGNFIVIIIIMIIFLIILDKQNGIKLAIVLLSSQILNRVLKEIIKRPRPNYYHLIKEKGFSFPSGHSMAAMALYGFLIYIVISKIKNKYLKTIFIILLVYIILTIGISRIYLGVHYPSDVLCGYLLSLTIIIGILTLFDKYMKKTNYSGGVYGKTKKK
ncbi:MAG: phosphatase PAP2 family protein [Bacilli bacterium]|nr:phosphatase PAP2 family protein [Bacilli bacterium]